MELLDTSRSLQQIIDLHAPALTALLFAAWSFPGTASAYTAATNARDYSDTQVAVLYPCDGSTVFDSDGEITVQLIAPPAHELHPGDRIELTLDGRQVRHHDGEQFVLTKLGPGRHLLRVRVVDTHGRAVLHADPVRFYMWQASSEGNSQ